MRKLVFQHVVPNFSTHAGNSHTEERTRKRTNRKGLRARSQRGYSLAVTYILFFATTNALILSFWLLGLAPSSLGLQELNFPGTVLSPVDGGLGWLGHKRPRVIDRPVPGKFSSWRPELLGANPSSQKGSVHHHQVPEQPSFQISAWMEDLT